MLLIPVACHLKLRIPNMSPMAHQPNPLQLLSSSLSMISVGRVPKRNYCSTIILA